MLTANQNARPLENSTFIGLGLGSSHGFSATEAGEFGSLQPQLPL